MTNLERDKISIKEDKRISRRDKRLSIKNSKEITRGYSDSETNDWDTTKR